MTVERLQLLTRRNCHLCELARSPLADLAAAQGLGISEFDVDEDPALLRQFTDRVPVVLYRGQVLAEGRIDPARLREGFVAISTGGGSGPDDSVTVAERKVNRG